MFIDNNNQTAVGVGVGVAGGGVDTSAGSNLSASRRQSSRSPRRGSLRRRHSTRSDGATSPHRDLIAPSGPPQLLVHGQALARQRLEKLLQEKARRAVEAGVDDTVGDVQFQVSDALRCRRGSCLLVCARRLAGRHRAFWTLHRSCFSCAYPDPRRARRGLCQRLNTSQLEQRCTWLTIDGAALRRSCLKSMPKMMIWLQIVSSGLKSCSESFCCAMLDATLILAWYVKS